MGSGNGGSGIGRQELDKLLDLIESSRIRVPPADAYVDGDGSTNGAFAGWSGSAHGLRLFAQSGEGSSLPSLSPDHTIWQQNRDYWVERLKEATGGAWADHQYDDAARAINTAEYQRLLFSEFAGALSKSLAGVPAPWGLDGRFGDAAGGAFHETIALADADSGEALHVSIQAAIQSAAASFPVGGGGDVDGAAGDAAPGVDPELLLRDLSTRHMDLAAFASPHGRDYGFGRFNHVRAELYTQLGLAALLPYHGWQDFQARNQLSDDIIEDLKAAYPDGFSSVDLWVGALAESPIAGELGTTAAAILSQEIHHLKESPAVVDFMGLLGDSAFGQALHTQSFSDLLLRHAAHLDFPAPAPASTVVAPAPPIEGTDGADTLIGTDGDDVIHGHAGDDIIKGGGGNDQLYGDAGDDIIDGGAGDDLLDGGDGADSLVGGAGNDSLFGRTGNDHLYGGDGDNELHGGEGDDWLHGGYGNNLFDGGTGDDLIESILAAHYPRDAARAPTPHDAFIADNDDVLLATLYSDTIVLRAGFGNDVVIGFDPHSSGSGGQDHIDVSAYITLSEASIGTEIIISENGTDTVITIGSDTLRLTLVDPAAIDRSDFFFS